MSPAALTSGAFGSTPEPAVVVGADLVVDRLLGEGAARFDELPPHAAHASTTAIEPATIDTVRFILGLLVASMK
jgi:hypothetical protein